jgi:integrase/recombinase XerD
MTSQPNVSPLRQRMIDDMRMRQLSPKTPANYLRIVREFSRYLGRSPDTATVEDLRGYQLHLVDHGTSPVSLNSAITGLKFFFGIALREAELMARMQPVRVWIEAHNLVANPIIELGEPPLQGFDFVTPEYLTGHN